MGLFFYFYLINYFILDIFLSRHYTQTFFFNCTDNFECNLRQIVTILFIPQGVKNCGLVGVFFFCLFVCILCITIQDYFLVGIPVWRYFLFSSPLFLVPFSLILSLCVFSSHPATHPPVPHYLLVYLPLILSPYIQPLLALPQQCIVGLTPQSQSPCFSRKSVCCHVSIFVLV